MTPWNLSTVSYDNISIDISSYDIDPKGISFNSSGSVMIVTGRGKDKLIVFNLLIPWNISSSIFNNLIKFDLEGNMSNVYYNFIINRLYMINYNVVYQYNLN